MRPYKKRLVIPVDLPDSVPNLTVEFYNSFKTLLAVGYSRIVIGKRGPYVEFYQTNIKWDKFFIPDDQLYRRDSKLVFYEEWRSNDVSFTKLYLQKRTVAYADYKINMIYMSPSDLYLSSGQRVLSD